MFNWYLQQLFDNTVLQMGTQLPGDLQSYIPLLTKPLRRPKKTRQVLHPLQVPVF